MKSFNLNNYVYVKLTDKGRDIYYHQYDHIQGIKPSYPKEDNNGYFKEQLWQLMKTFGKHMSMGFDQPFSTDIIFEEAYLKEVKL